MKRLYRAEFRAAFTEALEGLGARHKNMIRLAFVEGLSIDTLGAFHGVHRSTAARWIVDAERALFGAIRARFRERLGVDDEEYASILRLVKSRLDVTFETYLRLETTKR
jgi:RNA polymerase sigma-70 factor (ECF subfamily)